VPWKFSAASLMIVSISGCEERVKPWRISHLKVPPGGSVLGFVQYMPLIPRLS